MDRYPPQDNFSVAINSQKGLTEIQYVDGRHSPNLQIEKAVATTYYCMKRNVALEIGPMTSLLKGVDSDVIYSTTQFYTILHDTSNL